MLLGTKISAPKFKSSKIYLVTQILKKTVFITSQVISSQINSEMEHFRVSRNQILFHTPTMVEVVITQYEQSLYP